MSINSRTTWSDVKGAAAGPKLWSSGLRSPMKPWHEPEVAPGTGARGGV